MWASRRLYPLGFCLALGAAVACGDEKDSAADGKGGSGDSSGSDSGGKSGKGGTSGTGGCTFTGGNSGAGNQCSTGGTGLVAGGQGGEGGEVVCNDLDFAMGPTVPVTLRQGSGPTPTGGTIENGTYFLTGVDAYASQLPFVGTFTFTLVIDGDHAEFVGIEAYPHRESWDLDTSGPDITITRTCPDHDVESLQYTATQGAGAELLLIRHPEPDYVLVETWTQQ